MSQKTGLPKPSGLKAPTVITKPTTVSGIKPPATAAKASGTGSQTAKSSSVPVSVGGKTISSINKERDAAKIRDKIKAEKEAMARKKLEKPTTTTTRVPQKGPIRSTQAQPSTSSTSTTSSSSTKKPPTSTKTVAVRKPQTGGTVSVTKSTQSAASTKGKAPESNKEDDEHWKMIRQIKLKADVRCLCDAGKTLWEGSRDGTIHVRSLDAGEEIKSIKAQKKDVKSDDKFFVNVIREQFNKVWVADSYGHLRAYSADGSTILHHTGKGSQAGTKALQVSEEHDQQIIISGGEDWTVLIYGTGDAALQKNLVGHKGWIHSLCMDEYQRRLWSGGADGIRVWTREALQAARNHGDAKEKETGEEYCVKMLDRHSGEVTAMAAVDGNVWTGGRDSFVCVWRASDYKLLNRFQAHEKTVDVIKYLGQEVLTGSQLSSKVKIWASGTCELVKVIDLPFGTKIVDIVHNGRFAWIGGRSPGALVKFTAPAKPAKSKRPDGIPSDIEAVDGRTFRRWVNHVLAQSKDPERAKLQIPEGIPFQEALKDGVILTALVDEVDAQSGNKHYEKLNLLHKTPGSGKERLANIQAAMEKMKRLHLEPKGVTAEAIEQGEAKPCLDLVWELIRKYHIKLGYADNRTPQELLKWVNGKVKPYIGEEDGIIPVQNWDWAWYDGYALSALADHLQPGTIEFGKLDYDDPAWNVENAMLSALKNNEVPRLMDVADMVHCPFPRSVMTYAACFRPQGAGKLDPTASYIKGPGVTDADGDDKNPAAGSGTGELSEADWTGASSKKGPVEFSVFAKDSDGAPALDCKCECKLTGPNGSVPVMVSDKGDGRVECQYDAPLPPGEYRLDCTLDGHPVQNSPVLFTVHAPLDPSKSYAEGPGLDSVEGQPIAGEFTVYAIDDTGAPAIGAECKVVMNGPDGPVWVDLVDNNDGTFSAKYNLPLPAGDYTVNILLDDIPIGNSPYKFTVEKKVDADKSYAEGPGLAPPTEDVVGSNEDEEHKDGPGEFTIYALDSDGDLVPTAQATATMTGPAGPVDVQVVSNGDGSFAAHYDVPLPPGDYVIDCLVDNKSIKGFPMKLHIAARVADPLECFADGPGLWSPAELAAQNEGLDEPLLGGDFTVYCRDSKQEPVLGSTVDATMQGPNGKVPLTVQDQADGTFACKYDPNLPPGDYTIDIKVDGKPIKDSPFKIHVKKPADLSKSFVDGPGISSEGQEKGDGSFIVHAIAADGTPAPEAQCEVDMIGPNGPVDVVLKNRGDGTFGASYDAPLPPGKYDIHVSLDGQPVKGSPFTVVVIKDATAGDCYAEGPGLDGPHSHPELEDPTTFQVFAKDEDGKPVLGTSCGVKLVGPDGKLLPVTIKDNKDGSFTCSYKDALKAGPLPPGEYTLKPTINDKPVSNAPCKFVVPLTADAGKSSVKGPGLSPHKLGSGKSHFDLFARDDHNRPVVLAPEQIKVVVQGPEGEVPVEIIPYDDEQVAADPNHPTHHIVYHPTVAGKHAVDLQLNNKHLKGLPAVLLIKKGASGAHTTGVKFSFTVVARDEQGELKTEGGDRWEVVGVYGNDTRLQVQTKDHKDGSYEATYKLEDQELYTLDARINGQRLTIAPIIHDLRPHADDEESF